MRDRTRITRFENDTDDFADSYWRTLGAMRSTWHCFLLALDDAENTTTGSTNMPAPEMHGNSGMELRQFTSVLLS